MSDDQRETSPQRFEQAMESADEGEPEGLTLEELSRAYSQAVGNSPLRPKDSADRESSAGAAFGETQSVLSAPASEANPSAHSDSNWNQSQQVPIDEDSGNCTVNPLSVTEAILFIGRSDNSPITAAEIAELMRGVSEAEVVEMVDELNLTYEKTQRATRIVVAGIGYRLALADDLQFMTDQFYGRVREIKLNQPAIDCLALVAYQPGISRAEIEQQRASPSGNILNLLVRRQLLAMRRDRQGKEVELRYYPTERLMQLTGLASLDDLPQTEDFDSV